MIEKNRPSTPVAVALQSPIADLQSAILACRAITRRANSSFPLAFRLLPPAKRDAMFALYAFLRVTDDLADEPGDPAAKRADLRDWRTRLRDALSGRPTHPVHTALTDAVRRFDIDPDHLEAVIDGVETDLEPVRFDTFDKHLYPYCWRVASAVGLACVAIWGCRDPERRGLAQEPAAAAGIAFQLTNVLRDLGEDLERGRVYLPADELERFDCPPERWREPAYRERFRELMRFQTARARRYYTDSEPLTDLLTTDGRAVWGVMSGLYRRLLDEIECRDFDVFSARVRVGRLTKARLYLAAWPVRWGLL